MTSNQAELFENTYEHLLWLLTVIVCFIVFRFSIKYRTCVSMRTDGLSGVSVGFTKSTYHNTKNGTLYMSICLFFKFEIYVVCNTDSVSAYRRC